MAGEKVTMILRSKTDLSDDEISAMTNADGWKVIYSLRSPTSKKKENQVCFTGFSPAAKKGLSKVATDNGMDVVKSVTKSLAYLCTGSNAGPAKIKKAREQGAILMDAEQFHHLLNTGEIPNQVE